MSQKYLIQRNIIDKIIIEKIIFKCNYKMGLLYIFFANINIEFEIKKYHL